MCTRITAFVFLLIFFNKSLGSILSVLSISQQTGLAPDSIIASTVATKVKDCVITSSSFFNLRVDNATLIAAVPEVTARAYFELNFFLNNFSNSFTL